MKVYLPYHLGAGNRGCEGIARGISELFKINKADLILFDITRYDFEIDNSFELNKIAELRYPQQNKLFEIKRLFTRLMQKFGLNSFYNNLMSDYYIRDAQKGDWVLITGGDIYCYEGAAELPNLIIKKAKKRGLNTALFGVSMEQKFLTEEIVDGLNDYDIIITRESISSKNLNDVGLKNYLFPDPAFILECEKIDLPEYFNQCTVGINISPYTNTDKLFENNLDNLIEYLIERKMQVCFIPHVFWKGQNDLEAMKIVQQKYQKKYGNNVHILNSNELSYLQIRYAISKCYFFIGGRTHSVISAYCSGVPCIALGYSVKARGIARDICMPDYTLIDSKNLSSETELLDAFIKTEENRNSIIKIYENISKYKDRLYDIDKIIKL